MSTEFNSSLTPSPSLVYPIIEVRCKERSGKEWLVPGCLFHDLLKSDDMELSWAGGNIIANMINGMKSGQLSQEHGYRLGLQMAPNARVIPIPWPGMPDDQPIPLDLDKLPFDISMFMDTSDMKFKRRMDRQKFTRGLESTWVVWLKAQMRKHGSVLTEGRWNPI